ncbi:hypothetical protein CXB51_001212 [Gossypium anomalum]|uniref:Retrovirus-related Pol polyprotein from transposon TNT 1-94-like beta-barrel domain-containing protein n=1 Tax=Gossypium anomalum TaxID=47600 RepID=A0A8J6DC55_9ROSI|nr:hypothetical protein CXB51_001212 [Gossypium anomalum]
MQAVLAQMDLEDALLGIDKMLSTLTDEEKKQKTAAVLWKGLEQICMSKTLTSKLHMKQRLYAHRLDEGASVYEHLTVFKEILSNLEALEVQYDKEDLGLILICSLPPSYSTFRDTILHSRESLTVDEGESLIARGRQDRNADNDRGRTQEQNPRGKSKGRSKSSNRENSGEADIVEDYSDGELLVASINDSKVSEEWILDSGCTFHMSPNRDWFTIYEIVSESVVLIGINASCKIAGVGTIKVKMFDGVVRTLSDVRDGSTVTGDTAIASSSLSDDDITKIWHMRLGHMSENGMGPSRVPLRGGANYMLTFIYDFSRKVWEFFLKQKSDVFSIVQVRRDRETPDSSSYSTAKLRCRMNEQNNHGESSIHVVKCQLTEVVLINRSPSVAIEKKTSQEVFKKKEGTPGVEEPRYKARLVAKGYS